MAIIFTSFSFFIIVMTASFVDETYSVSNPSTYFIRCCRESSSMDTIITVNCAAKYYKFVRNQTLSNHAISVRHFIIAASIHHSTRRFTIDFSNFSKLAKYRVCESAQQFLYCPLHLDMFFMKFIKSFMQVYYDSMILPFECVASITSVPSSLQLLLSSSYVFFLLLL